MSSLDDLLQLLLTDHVEQEKKHGLHRRRTAADDRRFDKRRKQFDKRLKQWAKTTKPFEDKLKPLHAKLEKARTAKDQIAEDGILKKIKKIKASQPPRPDYWGNGTVPEERSPLPPTPWKIAVKWLLPKLKQCGVSDHSEVRHYVALMKHGGVLAPQKNEIRERLLPSKNDRHERTMNLATEIDRLSDEGFTRKLIERIGKEDPNGFARLKLSTFQVEPEQSAKPSKKTTGTKNKKKLGGQPKYNPQEDKRIDDSATAHGRDMKATAKANRMPVKEVRAACDRHRKRTK